MVGLNSLEVYKSIVDITEGNHKLKRYQGYNDRFLWNSIKHKETEGSLIRIESQVLCENVKN